jgi:PEGA domain-containing protein
MSTRPLSRKHWLALTVALLVMPALAGCVERRYTIRTDPPGAQVIVNGEEIGPSPVSRSFTFYGDRDITLINEGYQTQRLIQPIKPPWWDNLLTEFFTENLIPITFRDERDYAYKLAPATNPPINELLDRSQTLRAIGQTEPPPRRGGILGFFGF